MRRFIWGRDWVLLDREHKADALENEVEVLKSLLALCGTDLKKAHDVGLRTVLSRKIRYYWMMLYGLRRAAMDGGSDDYGTGP